MALHWLSTSAQTEFPEILEVSSVCAIIYSDLSLSNVVVFREILEPSDGDFNDAISIYKEAFESKPETYIDPKYFSQSSGRITRDMEWHFCVLTDKNVVGMIAFASTIFGGYGGYVAVRKELRHRGYGSILLKNMVDILRKDSEKKEWDIKFLFAEYEDENKGLWESKGFTTLPVEYFQPPLTETKEWFPMNLGAFPLTEKGMISGKEILNFATFLYSKVYWAKGYSKTPEYKKLEKDCRNLTVHLRASR